MRAKLDLHTHIWEGSGFQKPNREWAEKVVRQANAMGIHGIAITEHRAWEPAFAYKELIEKHFPGQLLIFPGWEIEVRPKNNYFEEYQVGEFLLPNNRVFRNYCHPGYPSPTIEIENVQSIEIDNLLHNWHIDKARVEEIAREHGLLLVKASDAHRLEDIGTNYIEVDLEEFYAMGILMEGWSEIP